MLRDVVGTFLESLTEREFDGPLLALLADQGFTDIHFIHGSYEFGKDIIAKRISSSSGVMSQYAIQSKAGDINQSSWREIRPQLEEAEYNTRAHPNFDETLPRVAVLVTTGRLKGAAAIDAQEFRASVESRGLADFEVWDKTTVANWLSLDPSLGVVGTAHETDLIQVVAQIRAGNASEVILERYTRSWLWNPGTPPNPLLRPRAAIEAAILGNLLRTHKRLDLAAFAALHLLRAVWADELQRGALNVSATSKRSRVGMSAVRLFVGYAEELLEQVEPFLEDPRHLCRAMLDEVAIVTYPAFCCRAVELFALLALVSGEEASATGLRARASVVKLAEEHPGSQHPVSDQAAVSILAPTIVLAQSDHKASVTYLTRVAQWLLDRHDPDLAGLGLASIDESDDVVAERLLGGALEATKIDRRSSSYLGKLVMDLASMLRAEELYEAVRHNLDALRIVPCTTAATEERAGWRRGGDDVWPQPSIEYPPWSSREHSKTSFGESLLPAIDSVLLASVTRSRHDVSRVAELIPPPS